MKQSKISQENLSNLSLVLLPAFSETLGSGELRVLTNHPPVTEMTNSPLSGVGGSNQQWLVAKIMLNSFKKHKGESWFYTKDEVILFQVYQMLFLSFPIKLTKTRRMLAQSLGHNVKIRTSCFHLSCRYITIGLSNRSVLSSNRLAAS